MSMDAFKDRLIVERLTLAFIVGLTVLKALAFFALRPAIEPLLGSFYGVNFADNYQLLAANLVAGNGFRFTPDTALTLMREPGYPVVLAGLFWFFGVSLTAARVMNLVLGVCSAVLVARMAIQITGNRRASRIAAILFMIHPGLVIAELRGGVESLFIFLMLVFLTLILRALRTTRLVDYAIAGLALGVASLVRGTALLFPLFLFGYFLLWERRLTPLRWMIARVAVTMLVAMIALSPWIARNYALVGKFAPTASVAGVSSHAGQYICTHMSFQGQLIKVDGDAATQRAQMARDQGYRFKDFPGVYYLYFYDVNDEVKFNHYLGEQVFQNYLHSPALLASCVAKNAFNFWFAGKNWTSTMLNAIVQLPYLVLAGLGLFYGLRGPAARQVSLLGLFILYTLSVYLPILAQARYSVHVVPLLAVLAGVFLAGRERAPRRPDPLKAEQSPGPVS